MKIRLAVAEKDEVYLRRLSGVFTTKYAENLEVYLFTEFSGALKAAHEAGIDIVVSCPGDDVEPERLPEKCAFAYLTDSAGNMNSGDYPVIYKYQKADMIYKEILNIISERIVDFSGEKKREGDCGIIAFASPAGGAGSSSLAAACALRAVSRGKRTMYLNLETVGCCDDIFSGAGNFTMSNVIYALKSGSANLSMKLESCLKQDSRGVYFYSSCPIALDMTEMSLENKLTLIEKLAFSGFFDVLVLDCEFGLDKEHWDILNRADRIIVTADGNKLSETKIRRACSAILTRERDSFGSASGKMSIIYNKFSSKTGKEIEDINISSLGSVPNLEKASALQAVSQIAKLPVFDRILN